jgi:hypothetical protein
MSDVTLTAKEFSFMKDVFCSVLVQHPVNMSEEGARRFSMPEWDALLLKLDILKED